VTLQVSIDPDDQTAPFEQLRRQVEAQISAGRLAVGDRLPPVRTLAAELGVANGTVARAYKELEHAGLIETRGRNGTLVAGVPARREGSLRAEAAAYVAKARVLGFGPDEIVAAVRAELG